MKSNSSSRTDPEDLILAQERSAARHRAGWKKAQESMQATANGLRLVDQLQNSHGDGRPERGTRSRTSRPSAQRQSDDDEPPPSFKRHELPPDTFYGGAKTRRSSELSLYETCPSTRASERDLRPRQQRPRNPSPPQRWTTLNPDWAREWHSSIIYPAKGKDKASVDMRDIEKLDEGEFLNDNLIVFYLRWLQHRLEQEHPKWAKRIFFQNTFFYERLTHAEKGMKGINYAAVERWTAKVNLLDYDYIIIPVNEHAHWYVAIICNAPKLLPSAEVMDHFQSQGDAEAFGDQRINVKEVAKPVSASTPLPKQSSEIPNEIGADVDIRGMSLEEKKPELTQESDWPDDNLELAPMPRRLQNMRSVSNGSPKGLDVVENGSPGMATVTSDLPVPSSTLKASQTKKSKRKSIPTPRKYDPKEFRIITLDSLGTSHSSACTNLKEYLIQEIKAKLNIDIPRPGSIGTTAKNIPLQTNYYDCGLFLLSYIEMFLKNPDDFVSGILQNELDVDMQWPKASEMRVRIRDLLFDLQREQLADADRLGKGMGMGKGKEKKISKLEVEAEIARSTKSSSREASKSTRASPDGRNLEDSRTTLEKTIRPNVELPIKELFRSGEPHKSASGEPPIGYEQWKSNGVNQRALPVRDESQKLEAPVSRPVRGLDADNKSSKPSGSMFNEFLSNVTTKVSELLNNDKSRVAAASKPVLLDSDVIEINDSPQKSDAGKVRPRSRDSEMQDSFRMLVEDKTDVLENGRSALEQVETQGTSRTRLICGAQSSHQSAERASPRDLASPTPDPMESIYRNPDEHNFHDLRSPSLEDFNPLHHGQPKAPYQRLRSPDPKRAKAYHYAAEDRERATRAPSPDVVQMPSLSVRDRRPTPYPANGLENPREEKEFTSFRDDPEIYDSMDEEDAVDLVNPEPGFEDVSKTAKEASASDAEMLFQSKGSQDTAIEILSEEEAVEDANPSLLSESPASASKKYREGGQSTPSSPAQPHDDTGRKEAITSPRRGRKRKIAGESGDWQHLARPSPALRDSSDQAVIGRHRRGTHTKFND
jgi:hypothetical protein